MKKYIFLILIMVLSISCSPIEEYFGVYDRIEIAVENASDDIIENIVISTTGKCAEIKFESLEMGECDSASLSLKDNKNDGQYIIKFTRKGEESEEHELGYYSNGISLEKILTIKISNDSCDLKYPNGK